MWRLAARAIFTDSAADGANQIAEPGKQVVIATAADGSWQQYQIAANGTLSLGNTVATGTGPLTDLITLSSFSVTDGTHNFSVIQRTIGTTGGTVILSGGQP
mgnify:CR=1 FL=1